MGARVRAPLGRRIAALVTATFVLVPSRDASSSPSDGEARPILRDADRVYTTVAGEGDGASTVTNPANLGFLRGFNGIADLSWTKPSASRRGDGFGILLGVPLPWQIAALGIAYQYFDPLTPGPDRGDTNQPQNPDDPYSKLTFAAAIPLERWIKRAAPGTPRALRRFSLGLSYSRAISSQNFHAARTNGVDLALSWWPSRFLAFGFVARGINVPRTGPSPYVIQPYVLEPELALHPLGTNTLEIAAGVRFAPGVPLDPKRFVIHHVDPRGRIVLAMRGVRLFAEAERMAFWPVGTDFTESRDGVRLTAGVGLDFGHFGIMGGATASAGGAASFGVDGGVARVRVSQERYTSVVNVQPRLVTRIALRKYKGDRGLWQLLLHLEEIEKRRGVALVETDGMSLSYAQLEEVREGLLRLQKRGGKVVAYLRGGGLRAYFVAASADRIVAHPNASLEILGMRIQTLYFADLLEKLGAKAEFVRVAEYKGTPDVWQRSTATAPVASQRKMYFSDVWNHVLRTAAQGRGQDPAVLKEWIDAAPLATPDALRDGAIDELSFADEIDARLERWLGRKVRVEEPDTQKRHVTEFGPQQRIAVLTIEGDIVEGDSFTIPLLGRKLAGSRSITKQIAALRKDDSVRAVVVRIDSPGGSVQAADDIARELDLTRKRKPVVISMGTTCASGGYYIATGGQYIYADATTATGSIGIFYPKLDLSGFAEKLGIGIDEQDYGDHAGLRSWWKPYSPSERAAAQRDIEESYREFTARVARARSMTPEQVDEAARGRVWSGVRAIEIGLVDDYGGMREAVARARAIVGIGPDVGDVVLYPEPLTPLENIRAVLGVRLPNPFGVAAGIAGDTGLGAIGSATAIGQLIPRPLVRVLAMLPASLWYGETPGAQALAEESFVIDD
jgi:protease-4